MKRLAELSLTSFPNLSCVSRRLLLTAFLVPRISNTRRFTFEEDDAV